MTQPKNHSIVKTLTCAMLGATMLVPGPARAEADVEVSVLEQTDDRIVIQYALEDHRTQPIAIEGGEYVSLQLDGATLMMEKGAPALPKISRSVIIPDDARIAVNVIDAEFNDLPNTVVAPSKGSILRTVDPASVPHTFGEAYVTDAFYPGKLATLGKPYIMRDYRGVVVRVFPFQNNPVTRTLRVCTRITVELVRTGPAQVNVFNRPLGANRETSGAFHEIYARRFINYGDARMYAPLNEDGDMLVIAYDAWMNNVQPLASHKLARGMPTTMVGVSTIPGGNNANAIKNYIQTMYDTTNLSFVLLVGDAAQVATPRPYGDACDPTYALLAGNDDYPDIIVGRISAENQAQVDTQIQRTIDYEMMPAPQQDWFWKGVGIASNQGPGDDGEYDNQHMDNIREDLLNHGYTHVDRIYDPTANEAQVANAVNDGRGIINYCGHGSTTSWGSSGFSNAHVNALVNDNMLPFITSVACVNGRFDGPTCFAEAWLRATHNGQPTGAVGMYASSVNQYWDEPMAAQDEFVDQYIAEGYTTYGALCYAGSCLMMDEYGNSGVDMFETWHIFGDPSLKVVQSLLGDCDNDGDVDLYDFEVYLDCYTGPSGAIGMGCGIIDLDADGDVDKADLAVFILTFTG